MVNPLININKMEENKETKVKSAASTQKSAQSEKMSYEQLENIAHQLSEQVKQLYVKLQEANMANMFKRLDYLFKIVENAHSFDRDFVLKCIAEIEDIITIPESKEDKTEDSAE